MSDEPEMMNSSEAADYLRVSSETVCEWARKGLIPGAKIGRDWVFMRSHLREHVAKLARENVRKR